MAHSLLTTPSLRGNIDRLVARLCQVPATTNASLQQQLAEIDAKVASLRSEIAAAESAMNETLFALYRLKPAECAMVLAG